MLLRQSVAAVNISRIAEANCQSVFNKSSGSLYLTFSHLEVMMKRILVIESDAAVRELMGITLRKRGYQVSLAQDVLLGYDTALFVKPDLIVTDIELSGTDGINIIKQIRDTPSLLHVRILVTTAFGTGTATFSLQNGADGYEPKPIDPHSFLMTVERLLADSDGLRAA